MLAALFVAASEAAIEGGGHSREGGASASIAAIAEALWGAAVDDRAARAAVRAHVVTLRRKLAAVGLPEAIEVQRGTGYRLTLEVE
ncbi:MAG: helix-turn-helix domain-containing protein [Dehalococcoidia bacterium]|nr:helix-turn-helix domain-containing protein [Dehalococcoidia bacterium]